MATAAILKNRKILIFSQPIDRFWQNLAYWCVSTLWTTITNKISRFQKSKMASSAILKIRKNAISPQRNDQFWQISYSDAPRPSRYSEPSWKAEKNHNIFATGWLILTKFGMLMLHDIWQLLISVLKSCISSHLTSFYLNWVLAVIGHSHSELGGFTVHDPVHHGRDQSQLTLLKWNLTH